jgi:integrase
MWREYVTLPDGTQKAERKSRRFTGLSERAARSAFAAIMQDVHNRNTSPSKIQIVEKSEPTLRDAVEKWRSRVAINWKPRGRKAAESHLRAHIMPKLGSVLLTELTLERVQDFVSEIGAGRSGKTVSNIVTTLCGILKAARKWQWSVSSVSITDLDMPPIIGAEIKVFQPLEIKKMLDAADEPLRIIIALLATTAMRINEALALRVEDIDLDENVIHIRHSVAPDGSLGTPKSKGSQFPIPLSNVLARALRQYLESEHYRKNPLNLLFANGNKCSAPL